MRRTITGLALAVLLGGAGTAAAQTSDAVPRFVVDIRGVTAGLPTAVGWTPVIPATTEVPSRGLGLDGGAHVFILRSRTVSLGVGATWLIARSSTSTEPTDDEAPPTSALPDVATRVTLLAPQVSLNFGKRLGWSYISAGLGRGRASSTATYADGTEVPNRVDTWTRAINFGGGARWFINEHVGVGFDLRWHQLAAVTDVTTGASAPRETLLVLGIGVALR